MAVPFWGPPLHLCSEAPHSIGLASEAQLLEVALLIFSGKLVIGFQVLRYLHSWKQNFTTLSQPHSYPWAKNAILFSQASNWTALYYGQFVLNDSLVTAFSVVNHMGGTWLDPCILLVLHNVNPSCSELGFFSNSLVSGICSLHMDHDVVCVDTADFWTHFHVFSAPCLNPQQWHLKTTVYTHCFCFPLSPSTWSFFVPTVFLIFHCQCLVAFSAQRFTPFEVRIIVYIMYSLLISWILTMNRTKN